MRKPYSPGPKPESPKKSSNINPKGSELICTSEKYYDLRGHNEDEDDCEENEQEIWACRGALDMAAVMKAIPDGMSPDDFYIEMYFESSRDPWITLAVLNKKLYPKTKKQLKAANEHFKTQMSYYKDRLDHWNKCKAIYDVELLAYNKAEKERLEKEIKELEK